MTAIFVGSDHGPEADSDPLLCLRARADGYAPTCGELDHCPLCQLCADVHADTCKHHPDNWVTVRLGDHDYRVEFLLLTGGAPVETVLALYNADRLGYSAPADEWTDLTEPLPELFQHTADHLRDAGLLPRFTQET